MDKYIRHATVITVLTIGCLVNVSAQKIGGITLVAPPRAFVDDPMSRLVQVNSSWVALVPYAFNRQGSPEVIFGSDRQWWGERKEGIIESITLAKKNGLRVMIKPQVWLRGGWVGDMDFEEEQDWQIWEKTYRDYIMSFVDLAREHKIEMFCVGTEYRNSVKKRERFWRELIKEIRSVYAGKLVYSANWDDYDNVPFWDALDYVGISAYFPLSDASTPSANYLTVKWRSVVNKLQRYYRRVKRPILFTEFGYLSVDGAAGKTWELEKQVRSLNINEHAQANSLDALFAVFSDQDFWAGGFLWKWFPEGHGHEGYPERDYTPQNKAGEAVLAKWYDYLQKK